jgi:hypothetical protein
MYKGYVRVLVSMAVLFAIAITLQNRAFAGPPLICHPFEIGNAKSLPWNGSQWRDVQKDYDLNRLVEDTLALLTPETPILARMETMRRATIYAVWAKQDYKVGISVTDQKIADDLLARLMERYRKSMAGGKSDVMALFDAGYLAASYKHAGYRGANAQMDGTGMMAKAAAMRGGDAEMEFALALATHRSSQDAEHQQHLRKAIDGAKENSLLAKNLVRHFGKPGQQFADLRAQLVKK